MYQVQQMWSAWWDSGEGRRPLQASRCRDLQIAAVKEEK